MAWYYGTYSCGHEGRVNIIGPGKFRQYKAGREFEKVCPDCFEKQLKEEHEKEDQKILQNAKEMELPELQGSEKQIKWANSIRQEFIDKFFDEELNEKGFKYLASADEEFKDKVKVPQNISKVAYWCIKHVTNAHEWIENQEAKMILTSYRDALKTPREKEQEKAIEEIETESIVYPENRVTESIAKITYTKDKISTRIDHKNNDFINILKSLGYSYCDKWEKKIYYTAGKIEDRVAELGNKLLNKGFPIMILDEKVRNNAINGIYEKEHTRWIYLLTSGKYKGCFDICWNGYNDNLYETAKSIPGAHWNCGGMVCKVMHYREVQDFANLYNFKFTVAAQKAIEEYQREAEKIPVVNPVQVKEEQQQDNQLEDILNSSSDILEDLKDD